MGSFNSSGFISKLPIRYGDRVVCFIALFKNGAQRGLYYPDSLVEPFFLPIRGTYDDYGCVENIDRTKIVEMIEKYSGISIGEVLEGIERCLYGGTLVENINYWKKCNEEWAEHQEESGHWDDEVIMYSNLIPLFTGFFDDQFNVQVEYEGKQIPDVVPVLIMEHEDIYDQLTQDFVEFNEEFYSHIWPTPEKRFKTFMSFVEKIAGAYNDNKELFEGNEKLMACLDRAFPGPTGYYSPGLSFLLLGDEIPEDEKYDGLRSTVKELENSDIDTLLGSNSQSLKLFEKFGVEDLIAVYTEGKEELRRFYNLYKMFSFMPNYFTLSQTAGMQNYDLGLHEKLNTICFAKTMKMIEEEDKLEED